MNTLYLLRGYVKRALSLPFLLAIIGTVFLYFASTWSDMFIKGQDVYYFLYYAQRYGVFLRLIYIFCAIPFAANYARESIFQMRNYVVIRTTKRGYSWIHIVVCAISGGLALSFGVALYIIILSFKHPLFNESLSNLSPTTGFNSMLLAGNILGYYISVAYLEFLKGALWAVVGLCLSSYITTVYIAIFSPVIVSYIYIEVCKFLQIDYMFQLTRLLSPQYPMENPYIALAIATLTTVILILVLGIIFNRKVRVRIANE